MTAQHMPFTEAEMIKRKAGKPLLWIALGSIVMLFAAFTSAAIVSKAASKEWMPFAIPLAFYISTLIILLSSVSFHLAYKAAQKEQVAQARYGMLFTFLLGIVFTILQFMAWNNLVEQGVFFAGKLSTAGGSYMYVISGMHLLHLFGGLIALLFVFFKTSAKADFAKQIYRIELAGIYWHFLGGLWVYLFLFLLFISR